MHRLGQRAEVEDLPGGLARAHEHGDVERRVHGAPRRLRHLHRHHRARPRRLLPERGRRVVCTGIVRILILYILKYIDVNVM